MCCKGFLKRVLPFFLTFALGLLIASFFVTVAVPNFKFQKRGSWGNKHRQYHQRIESENQRLREENNLLKRQLIEKQTTMTIPDGIGDGELILEVPPAAPQPPQVKTVRGR